MFMRSLGEVYVVVIMVMMNSIIRILGVYCFSTGVGA